MQKSELSSDVIGIIQHVELNRSGWWERAVQRLVLAAVWLATEPLSEAAIENKIQSDFSLTLTRQKIHAALVALEKQGLLVILPGTRFRIPDKERAIFSKEIAEAEAVFSDARQVFIQLSEALCAKLDSSLTWQTFESDFLRPLIADTGANAYNLIAGQKLEANDQLSSIFLSKFDPEFHDQLKTLVTSFLDPKIEEVRSYVSRMLHARFCVEASGLPISIIQKLNSLAGKKIKFRIFVDTNFLFSLLELHENPSNEAARELLDLVKSPSSKLEVQLYVLPRTIDEAKTSISSAMHRVSRLPASGNFSSAAQQVGISGMAERFISERARLGGKLSAEDWFDPYLKNFVSIARAKGIELFNEHLDALATRIDVTDDILSVLKHEETRHESRRKSYEKVEHDMIMWHFIRDKRPAYIESPIDVQDWILTVDFRFIGFDEHKQRQSGSKVPICLHPTSLVQLLQFWAPRTKEFEEAMLGSIRLPFLFQEFDVEAERTSLRILDGLGRFEGRDDIPAQTIVNVVLNDGLRSRIAGGFSEEGADEVALIRDALLEEVKARADAEAKRVDTLTEVLTRNEATIGELDAVKRAKEEEIVQLREQMAEVQRMSHATGAHLTDTKDEVNRLKIELAQTTHDGKRRHALTTYFIFFALLILAVGIAAWNTGRYAADLEATFGGIPTKVLIAVFVFVIGHLIFEWLLKHNAVMTQLWPYRQVSRFRSWLWGFVILGFVGGVIGNLYANQVQEKLESNEHQQGAPAPLGTATKPAVRPTK